MKKVALAIHAIENFRPNIVKGLKGLDFIHVDVMDGKFVKNKNINLETFKILNENFNTPIIAHLMVLNPFDYIEKIINYIDIFLFHVEINENKFKIIKEVKLSDKEVGLVINPSTNITELIPYLDLIDIVLIMSVNPGFSGQKFIPETIGKVNELAKYKKEYNFKIAVDGGINVENAKKLTNADILNSSSTILNANDPNLVIESLKRSDQNGQ
ncbi:MAG: ribulose-phosphate 3-epimerase [Promethearchaeota archaeon]